MFDSFRKFLAEVSQGRKQPAHFEHNDYRLAAAALLVHAAAIDGNISELERNALHAVIKRRFGLDEAETDALVSRLDLVITVDTSVAHLAGALGRPTRILLPYLPDWRWLLGRDDSPWYPTVHLFRQDATRDYERVVVQVRSELDVMISGFVE